MEKRNAPLIIAGVAALVGTIGGTYLAMQSQSPNPDESTPVATVSPTPTVSVRPTTPVATVSPTPTVSVRPTTPVATVSPTPAVTGSPTTPAPTVSPTPTTGTTTPPPVSQPLVSQPSVCKITMARIDDPNPPLNVRANPAVAENNIVGQLENGTFVSVAREQNGWLEITDPTQGWISKDRTESGCNEKTQRITFASNTQSATISDQFIGTGSHKYLLNAAQGQTMTVEKIEGVLPRVVAPDGTELVGFDSGPSWTGELPATGDYTLELISQFRGYAYEFSVEVQ